MSSAARPTRCWGEADELYRHYHDEEWGRPVTDERGLFERIALEGFQAGLSWLTILRKREGFRRAFAGFEPDAVARFGESDVERLLANIDIVRNHAKIDATIANAHATVALRGSGSGLAELVWSYRPDPGPAPRSFEGMASRSPESIALSSELKRRGFRFVGPTTVYALMQACGLVNDHLEPCLVREEVAAEQAAAARRMGRAPAGRTRNRLLSRRA
jgi:DNA-3-methyladenine glycosylase I